MRAEARCRVRRRAPGRASRRGSGRGPGRPRRRGVTRRQVRRFAGVGASDQRHHATVKVSATMSGLSCGVSCACETAPDPSPCTRRSSSRRMSRPRSRSRARRAWDPDTHTRTYISNTGYSGSCPPTGTATITSDGTAHLIISATPAGPGFLCTADALRIAAVMKNVPIAPPTLAVTDGDTTRAVPLHTAPTPLDGYADLVAIRGAIRPQQTAARFVCANEDDDAVRFVEGHQPPPGVQPNPTPGPRMTGADPCAGTTGWLATESVPPAEKSTAAHSSAIRALSPMTGTCRPTIAGAAISVRLRA